MIPRTTLFGNPERAAVRLSNDGKYISFLAPVDGVLNVWVGPKESPGDAKAITFDKGRGIRSYFWAYNNSHILYTQDKDGDENWRVYAVNVESGEVSDLTPLDGVRAEIEGVSPDYPDAILVGLNDRDKQFHDLYRVEIPSGEKELVLKNEEFASFVTDDAYDVRFASKYNPDGSYSYYKPSGSEWKEFLIVPEEDTFTTFIGGFDKTGDVLYLFDSRDANTNSLTTLDLNTGEQKTLAHDDRADVGGLLVHPTEKNVQAVSFTYDRRRFIVLDPSIAGDIEALGKLSRGELQVVDRTLADDWWITAFSRDDGPLEYYLWDRKNQEATYLFPNRSDLVGLPLQPMYSPIIDARDGQKLVSYVTLPAGSLDGGKKIASGGDTDAIPTPATPLPMVLLVHGGPWSRDGWGFDSQHQLLANRGYAVLSVNFRGSTGLGKNFVNISNKQWAGTMHDDLLDAVNWAVSNGIADKDKIAIMGGSYGGYATLVGLTFTPDVFACGVDIVGPSNLVTLLNSIPPYWAPQLEMFKRRVGDPTTEEGRELLESRSPLNFVDRIERPLLIAQGANDPRVKQAEADQIVEAMTTKNIPVTYALYPDEGHGFARPENRISFYAVAEAFLARHLGGRYEEVGDAFNSSSITVPTGAEGVPGLSAALSEVGSQ